MNFNKLSLMRKERSLKQKEVAKILNVERSTISKWENGKTLPRKETLINLAKLYKCKIDELLI